MITAIDYTILHWIQSVRTPFWDTVFSHAFPNMAQLAALWIVICLVLIFTGKKNRIIGIKALTALVMGTILFTLITKNIVCRQRPFQQGASILDAASLLIPPPGDVYSFPSGHSVSSFAVAFSIFLHKKISGSICLVIAAVVAFSRMYLYVHFPSDVLFGTIFGILCAIASDRLIDSVIRKHAKKKPEL